MIITPLASGSSGNAYLLDTENTRVLLDCGIPFKRLKQKMGFVFPDICLVTHEHADHAKSLKDLQNYGVRIARRFTHNEVFTVGDFTIRALEMKHDVPCFGFHIADLTGDSLFFATDTAYIPYQIPPTTYLMVECNHDKDLLYRGVFTPAQEAKNKRLMETHMSIDSLLLWLEKTDLSKTKRIYLLHLSDSASNEEDFKRRVMEATGCPVKVC